MVEPVDKDFILNGFGYVFDAGTEAAALYGAQFASPTTEMAVRTIRYSGGFYGVLLEIPDVMEGYADGPFEFGRQLAGFGGAVGGGFVGAAVGAVGAGAVSAGMAAAFGTTIPVWGTALIVGGAATGVSWLGELAFEGAYGAISYWATSPQNGGDGGGGGVSSSRAPGVYGNIVQGYETNALDVIGDRYMLAHGGGHSWPPHCFPAGTPVRLASGEEVAIETIRAGDHVAAFNGGGSGVATRGSDGGSDKASRGYDRMAA